MIRTGGTSLYTLIFGLLDLHTFIYFFQRQLSDQEMPDFFIIPNRIEPANAAEKQKPFCYKINAA
jgi:hypothetical protein